MGLRTKQTKFWQMVAMTIMFATMRGTPIVILEWLRDETRQRILVARGSSKTMKSDHLRGLAIDFCFLEDLRDDGILNYDAEKYRPIGEFWEALDEKCKWGGRFNAKGDKLGWDCGHLGYSGL